jgi:hypothetical protein
MHRPPVNLSSSSACYRQRGGALAMTLHCVLLACVLGQIVFLASRHRVRWDLTSDGLYSLTDSTRGLIGKLDKQLLIEAYFSPQEKLPVSYRDTRTVLDNFLDELVQLGKGRVVLQRFDPNSDKVITERCQRIGVKPLELRSGTSSSISVDRHWQGLRFVYGGGKQKVLEQLAPQSSFQAEALLTPAIKEVLTTEKHKFGYMEWPATAVGQQQPGWHRLERAACAPGHPEAVRVPELQGRGRCAVAAGPADPVPVSAEGPHRSAEVRARPVRRTRWHARRVCRCRRIRDRSESCVHEDAVGARCSRQREEAARPVAELRHRLEAEGARRPFARRLHAEGPFPGRAGIPVAAPEQRLRYDVPGGAVSVLLPRRRARLEHGGRQVRRE